MGIIINDFEFPENCWSCPLRNNGYCVADKEHRYIGQGEEIKDKTEKKSWCPVKELKENNNA